MSAILKFDFQKKKTITFFCSKLSKLHKNGPSLHATTAFFLKQGETRTSSGPILHPLRMFFLVCLFVCLFLFVCSCFCFVFCFLVESGGDILFRVGRPGRGIFLPGYETIFPGISEIVLNLHFNEKRAFHSQTEQLEWLLSLISTFTCLL